MVKIPLLPLIMKMYFFLCDHLTEDECLRRHLAGTTSANFEWALNIIPGDSIAIYNFKTGDVVGPFTATSAANCYESNAWGGRFPVQVQFAITAQSRRGNLLDNAAGKSFLAARTKPPHILEGKAATRFVSWIAKEGRAV